MTLFFVYDVWQGLTSERIIGIGGNRQSGYLLEGSAVKIYAMFQIPFLLFLAFSFGLITVGRKYKDQIKPKSILIISVILLVFIIIASVGRVFWVTSHGRKVEQAESLGRSYIYNLVGQNQINDKQELELELINNVPLWMSPDVKIIKRVRLAASNFDNPERVRGLAEIYINWIYGTEQGQEKLDKIWQDVGFGG